MSKLLLNVAVSPHSYFRVEKDKNSLTAVLKCSWLEKTTTYSKGTPWNQVYEEYKLYFEKNFSIKLPSKFDRNRMSQAVKQLEMKQQTLF
jgi:hypothetical protein